jgi:hypothetical protein
VASKEVTTARFPEDAFNKGLVAVNYEPEESKEPDHTKCDPTMTYDVISEDPPGPFFRKGFVRKCVWTLGFEAERLDTRDNDTGEHKGFQGERKTVPHSTNHVQLQRHARKAPLRGAEQL